MARVTHFDLQADNPEGIIPFYEKIFDWKFEKWNGPMEYWMINTGPKENPGIDGGLSLRQKDNPGINTIEVKDVDKVLAQIKEGGGTIITKKEAIPGIGWFAQFEDPQKNRFGLMQDDPNAK